MSVRMNKLLSETAVLFAEAGPGLTYVQPKLYRGIRESFAQQCRYAQWLDAAAEFLGSHIKNKP